MENFLHFALSAKPCQVLDLEVSPWAQGWRGSLGCVAGLTHPDLSRLLLLLDLPMEALPLGVHWTLTSLGARLPNRKATGIGILLCAPDRTTIASHLTASAEKAFTGLPKTDDSLSLRRLSRKHWPQSLSLRRQPT